VGKRGTGIDPLRGQNNVQGACDMGALVNVLPGYQSVTDGEARAKFEQAWGVQGLPPQPGLTVTEMTNAAAEGALRGLYVLAENPMVSDPDVNHVREALERCEFLVVQDIFLTETAALADVVLPGSAFPERDGTVTSTDRSVQRTRKALDPPGEARADWEILCDLGRRCGGRGFAFASPEEVLAEVASVAPIYGGLSHQRLEREWLRWPCPTPDHPGTEFLHAERFPRGRGRFTAVDYRAPAEEPDAEYPFLLSTGRVIFHFHTRSMTGRSPTLEREVGECFVEVSPRDAAEAGIADGETVVLTSRRGRIEARARVETTVSPGELFVPFHFAENAANVLTGRAVDPVAKIPEYKVCAVSLTPARKGEA
jgi:predicted molibdopterin-dependent oxidoreductase YjgC